MTGTGGPDTAPARIAPLAVLPLFHKLEGRKAVVAGGTPGALWKAELLAAAGADLTILAGHASGAKLFAGLAARRGTGALRVEARRWRADDFAGAALAVGDSTDGEEAAAFAAAARAAGAVVNLVDRPELGDISFGTIVNRSPVVLAISTDGAAPMLGQSIRARIEAVLPRGLSAWADAAKTWRPRVKARLGAFADRRAFWERFVGRAWSDPESGPGEADFDRLIEDVPRQKPGGRVILVGAGPGDPELLTLRAVRALQSATVILYDRLVGPDILELARREARRISVGKQGHGRAFRQEEINRLLVRLAERGETVVRLKGGDPAIFGRAAEEMDACRAAGIDVSVVPGITAAQGAAASLGISLTERDLARRVQFVTGHGSSGALPDGTDWDAVADPETTTIVYMPRATLGRFTAEALARGLDPATPAIAIASATCPGEAHAAGDVTTIATLADTLLPGAPVTVIIGRVARIPSALSGFAALAQKAA